MSTLRAIATFLLLVVFALLAVFYMDLRGYEKVDRIQGYGLYQNDSIVCEDVVIDADTYRCGNQYILKDGFSEYTIEEALALELVFSEELLVIID